MAVLQQKSGSAPFSVYVLTAEPTRIGRQQDCEIYLASQDVSRYHARIFRERGRYLVEDLQSRNGTQVNGQTIAGPVALEDGDEIRVSSMQFTYLEDDSLLSDSSPSGFMPSVISLSSGSPSERLHSQPLVVGQGDQIPDGVVGQHDVNPDSVLARVPVGQMRGGWPTLKQPEDKLNLVLQLLNRMRGAVLGSGLLSLALDGLFELFDGAERIAVVLRSPTGRGFVVAAAGSREVDDEVRINVPLLYSAMESFESILSVEREDITEDLMTPPPDLVVRYLLGAPLLDADGTVRGAVQIDTCKSGGFEPLHAECLAILSHVISCRIDDCAAAEAETARALFNRSVQTADRLRNHLVPMQQPRVDGFRVCHQVITVPDVAADIVDYVRLSDGRLACFILDVPGRGPEAAGLMAAISPVVNRALMTTGSTATAIRTVEEELRTRMSDVPMVTSLCVAILDPQRSAVTVSIAGHCPVWHFSGDGVMHISEDDMTGPPLGAPREVYLDSELHLDEDDVLLFCSDGIARIPNEDGALVSQSDVSRLLQRADQGSRDSLEERVIAEIQTLQGLSSQQDDIALLVIHKTARETVDGGERTAVNGQIPQ